MSDLVFDERLIEPTEVQSVDITIERISNTNSGVRIWYVLLADNGLYYQRWSMLMNPIDEILFLAKPGDRLTLKYVKDTASDPVCQRFDSFDRLLIIDVEIPPPLITTPQ